ncbi:MAG TPA: hybrid sensor histidine kinase/response regulator, partial [Vicinamibacterales bacterium]|nr:hybrid sensor histidine kinase/response regulator [Vicinamibacterales bacterium]
MIPATRIDRVNILLVDDQPAKLLTYESILGELGENLITASSASEALKCLLDNEIAVVLVDVCMPDLDGYELAAMIRQHPRFQKTSIIFVSAILMTDLDRLRGYECGAVDYVPVPVVPEILRAKVSVFAELFRKTRALERLNAELEGRVTERTAALEASTQALQEANHRKDEFLAMLAHELRNPLAPIRTAVQLLRLKELAEPHRSRARDVIERQVEHLVNLIDDLLDVSRITRGMITLQLEPVLLGAIVARAVETARPAIDTHRHALEIDLPDELISIEGDKTRLVQVIANILHNAAKFTDPGGLIRLNVRREGQYAVINISDTGIGIAPELLPRIFDLFTQVHSRSERAQGGLGIGLALVRRLTEMHGGSVTVHSEGAGRGAEFVVRLPVMAPQVAGLSSQKRESGTIPQIDP